MALNEVSRWKGKPFLELSREELLDALTYAVQEISILRIEIEKIRPFVDYRKMLEKHHGIG